MRIGKRDAKRRLTGLTLPIVLGTGGAGVTWTVEEGDRARARSVLQFLEDRRVLYELCEVELPRACIASVQEIRQHLAHIIEQAQSSELCDPLRAMQAACREFLTSTQSIEQQDIGVADMWQGGIGSWIFNQAIGVLRARIGTSAAVIVTTFDVDVDEHLAKILPPPVEDEPAGRKGRRSIRVGRRGDPAALPAAEAES